MKYLMIITFLFLVSLPTLAYEFGIDRLREPEIITKLQGKNLAVLTHAAAKTKNGVHLIDELFNYYQLKKIFAPEHGLRTLADDWVGDGVDEQTGLPVISLYKRGSRAPAPQDLVGIDAIVIDLQDVGVRYYTYFSTIAEVMKVAAAQGIEMILLDRPNLLGGEIMEGKVLDPSLAGSFTAYHTVPTRHGMTLGELAKMVNTEKNLGAKLTVIEVRGWKRESLLSSFDREWIAPSPALIDIAQVGLYALWGALENFNLAIGRGQTNERSFKVIGAPFITIAESRMLARELNALGFKGVSFSSYSWDVTRATHAGKRANGVMIDWDGSEVRTDEFTYQVSSTLFRLFGPRVNLNQMAAASYGSVEMIEAIKKLTPWSEFQKKIDEEIAAFKKRRLPYLIY